MFTSVTITAAEGADTPVTGGSRRRRNRHGRGLRGPLHPQSLPRYSSRHLRFGETLANAIDRLAEVVGEDVHQVSFRYTMIPLHLERRLQVFQGGGAEAVGDLLSDVEHGATDIPTITVHRMAIESRVSTRGADPHADHDELATAMIEELTYRALVRAWSRWTGIPVEEIDPSAAQ